MFHVGQHVVCVDDDENSFKIAGVTYRRVTLDGLTAGRVYTVRIVGPTIHKHVHLCPVDLWLEELHRPHRSDGREPGFAAARFRPVDETKLSIFKAMLVSPPKETAPIGQ